MPDDPDYRPGVGSESQDDLLDVGRRRSLPRWALGVLWAVIAAVAITVVVARSTSSNHVAKPKPGPTSQGPAFPSSLLGASEGDLAVDGKVLYELSQGALYRLDITDPASPASDGVATIDGLNRTLDDASFHLVLDSATHHIWVVTYDASSSMVIEFDSSSLVEIGRLLWPGQVHAAAVLGGHLYLAANNAVVDIASAKAEPTTIAALTGQYSDIVADPTRSRLLLLDVDQGSHVAAYTPADGRADRGPVAPFGQGGLLVVGGTIWAGGFANAGAVLARLDPRTLKPVVFSELSPQLGPGAVPWAAGQHVLWVRSGGGGDGLWCVDATSGDQLQYWQYNGAVASTGGAGFVLQREGPFALQLSTCTG
jgi:hypothetical protein